MGLMLRLHRLALVLLTAFLSACSVYSVPGEGTVPVDTQPEYTEVESPSEQPRTGPEAEPPAGASSANQQLLVQSSQARDRGDYEQSLALLERAQRIDPRSGRVYLELATTHNARGDERQAQIVAERGLLYCIARSVCEGLRAYAN
ncbi:MAG: tetratricopeptide (TPR) repeat protein [Bacteroidia bacterium]|jgi:tetratricopeptide (TPR) repeat protein